MRGNIKRHARIIGLMGVAGAGKDTVGEMLQRGLLNTAHLDSFAAPLYAGLSGILGVPLHDLYERDTKEKPIKGIGVSPRKMLQTLGTEWGRDLINADLWAILALQRHNQRAQGVTILTDVRFENEVSMIKSNGGVLVNIIRPGTTPVEEHRSETLDRRAVADITLMNRGTLDMLANRVADIIEQGAFSQ